MSDFSTGVRPIDLIPGDPAGVREIAQRLGMMSNGLADVAAELQRIDASSWKGQAATAFRNVVHEQPDRYTDAASGFLAASVGLQSYAQALENAQLDAARAIATWEDGQAASGAWQQRHAAATAAAAQAEANPKLRIEVPSVSSADPGDEGRAQAESTLSSARANLDAAAARVNAVLSDAKKSAPHKPGLFSRVVHGVEHLGKDALDAQHWLVTHIEQGQIAPIKFLGKIALDGLEDGVHIAGKGASMVGIDPAGWAKSGYDDLPHWARSFSAGAWEGTVGMGTGLIALGKLSLELQQGSNPLRLLIDPEGYIHDQEKMGGAVWHAASQLRHPVGFGEHFLGNLVDAKGWREDKWKWAGGFVPLVVVAVASGGAGAAADDAGLEVNAAATRSERAFKSLDFKGALEHEEDSFAAADRREMYQHLIHVNEKLGKIQFSYGVGAAAYGKPDHVADGEAVNSLVETGTRKGLGHLSRP